MPPGVVQIVANGLSTDHPVPGLAFVDDSHIPVDDPAAIESIGRGQGLGRHGRYDMSGISSDDCDERQWWAATTEPDSTELGWCVRYHPVHGRSVVLVSSADTFTLYEDWAGSPRFSGPLLFRMGGYWWDGELWYRPMQVFDYASERYARRKVPSARAITAADLLDDGQSWDEPGSPAAAALAVADVLAQATVGESIWPIAVSNWTAHLRLWAERRAPHARPLAQCVVDISAPELVPGKLIGTTEMADLAGIAASTLRGYSARGENAVPAHQAVVAGRKMWSLPVATDWVESRERRPDKAAAALAATSELSVGKADLYERFAASFFSRLWSTPFRKLWRFKDESTARQRSNELAMLVATNLNDIVPSDPLKFTVRQAVLYEFQYARATAADLGRPEQMNVALWPLTAKMLDWFVRHHPQQAGNLINDIIGSAERDLEIPRGHSIAAIRWALVQDGKLDADTYDKFLKRVLPPRDADETFHAEGATVYLDGNRHPVTTCDSPQEAQRYAEKLNNDPVTAQLIAQRRTEATGEPGADFKVALERTKKSVRELSDRMIKQIEANTRAHAREAERD